MTAKIAGNLPLLIVLEGVSVVLFVLTLRYVEPAPLKVILGIGLGAGVLGAAASLIQVMRSRPTSDLREGKVPLQIVIAGVCIICLIPTLLYIEPLAFKVILGIALGAGVLGAAANLVQLSRSRPPRRPEH